MANIAFGGTSSASFNQDSALEGSDKAFDSNPGTTEHMLRKAVERHFDIEMVEVITEDDLEITKDGGSFTMRAAYEATVPLIANVSFLLDFDKSVEINAR